MTDFLSLIMTRMQALYVCMYYYICTRLPIVLSQTTKGILANPLLGLFYFFDTIQPFKIANATENIHIHTGIRDSMGPFVLVAISETWPLWYLKLQETSQREQKRT